MTKSELIEQIATSTGLSKRDVETVVESVLETITKTLTSGGEVTITGFGSFSVSDRKAREGVNPQNPSQKIHIPATKVPKFKAGKSLKDAVK